jgi:hypothetical protein
MLLLQRCKTYRGETRQERDKSWERQWHRGGCIKVRQWHWRRCYCCRTVGRARERRSRKETQQRETRQERDVAGERQVRSETEIEGKLQQVKQCIWREMLLLQYCKAYQRENNVRETQQERGTAKERHGSKETRRERDKSWNETLKERSYIR